MKLVCVLACAILAVGACGGRKKSSGTEIKIAAASDLSRAFEEVGQAFEKETGIHATFTFGSTGLLAKQIAEGAPFDLFAAANVSFVDKVVQSGACDGATKALYARGRIVLWSTGEVPKTLEELADPKYAKIAIANPDHAPYGKAAKEALEKAGVWNAVSGRIVQGENILQTLQYAKSGNVDVAIVALSLAVVSDGGSSTPIDPALHAPLDQALVVCGEGAAGEAARKFAGFVASPQGREIMSRYGFLLPGEQATDASGAGHGGGGGSGARGAARLDEAKVGALVDAWLAAQNAGDVAAYERLYAARFGGVKRVGARSWTFDREGWLADRRRMFRAPMTVTVEDRAIVTTTSMAVVRFRQTFTQGTFKDTGDKQLVVVETPGGLQIAREEMLRSTVVEGPGSAKATGFAVLRGGLVVAGEGGYQATGASTLVDVPGADYAVERAVEGLAPAWTKLVGAAVTLHPSGTRCSIAGFHELYLVTPHFSTTAEWRGDLDGDGTPESAPLAGDALVEAVRSAGGAAYLVADLGGCAKDGDVVGVLGAAAAAWTPLDDAALADRVSAEFEKHADFRALQADYAGTYGGQGAWTDADGGEKAVTLWRSPDGKTTYAIAAARAGEGCGDFAGELAVVYDVSAGAPKLVGALPATGVFPDVVVDTNGDGRPEIAADTVLWAWAGKGYDVAYQLDLGFRDCGC